MKDVAFLIEVMIETYYQESGKRPAGLLLGPAQYRDLCHQIRNSSNYLKQAHVDELISEYRGFPVFLKELPGIELMLDYREAFSNAYR